MEAPLVKLRDNFYSGYFTRCTEVAPTGYMPKDPLERDEFCSLLIRAIDAQVNKSPSLDWTTELDRHVNSVVLEATALTLQYWNSKKNDERRETMLQLKSLSKSSPNPVVSMLAAAAMASETRSTSDQLESLALTEIGPMELQLLRVAQLILIQRADLAGDIAKEMNRRCDDAMLTQLASAISAMALGNYQEAYLTYCDIIQLQSSKSDGGDSGPVSLLLENGKAVANMQQGSWAEAQRCLIAARETDNDDPTTTANLIACSQWLGDTANVDKYIGELRTKTEGADPLIRSLDLVSEAVAQFQASTASGVTRDASIEDRLSE